MDEKELQAIDAHLVHLGEWVGTENELDHEQGLAALNMAWKLTAALRTAQAELAQVREKAGRVHEALRGQVVTRYSVSMMVHGAEATIYSCDLCDFERWEESSPECHTPACPAAPDYLEKV